MPNALVRKLESYGPLAEDDKALIASLTTSFRSVAARSDIIREGEKPSDVNLILSGFAYRFKALQSGDRQIFFFLFYGDF